MSADFFLVFEHNSELKRFMRRRTRGIQEKNLQNMDSMNQRKKNKN
jgi:hypothetical protein